MNTKLTAKVPISRDEKRKVWICGGHATGIPSNVDAETVKDDLSRRICDNPSLQSLLGILGAESFTFEAC